MRKGLLCVASLILFGVAGCEEEEAGAPNEKVVEMVEVEANPACLRDLPEPSVSGDIQADLSLQFVDFTHSVQEGRNRYSHDRRFKETAGVGLHIYRGRICVRNGEECADACVRYRVDAGSSLLQKGHHVATPLDADRITMTYWARDDAGNQLRLEKELVTDGETIRETQ